MRVEKGSKKESGQGFSPWALSLQSPLHSARRLLGLKGPLGSLEILSDQHSIWIIYPRPNGACIAQRSCFDSLLQGRGHFSRKKADGFDYKSLGSRNLPNQFSGCFREKPNRDADDDAAES